MPVYLSLGNKEPKTKNPLMRTVGDRIEETFEILEEKAGCDAKLEWNQGNHFKEPDIRTAKGFAWCLNLLIPRQALRGLFVKIICFALVLFISVPASVVLSDMIDDSYKTSIQQTIDKADENSKAVQEKANGESDENALEKIFNAVKGGVTEQVDNFKTILSDFVEAAAVLIVTSCVIPLAVMLFFIWLLRMIVGVNITVPDLRMSEKIKRIKSAD